MVKMTGEDNGQVRVIDPEFTVYGPPGLDVGSLLSGYILAAVHHSYLGNETEAKKKAVGSITGGVKASWDAYKSELSKGGLSDELIREIEVESVGFAVAEVCRTALGFAGIRLWLQFDDPKVKEAAVQKALSIVQVECSCGDPNWELCTPLLNCAACVIAGVSSWRCAERR